MTADVSKSLSQTQHIGITTANIAIPLGDQTSRKTGEPGESIEICYLALGATLARIELHIARQRDAMPWDRSWICNPNQVDSVKIIVFPYRSTLNHAISAYSKFGVPVTEVSRDDIRFLIDEAKEILVGNEDRDLLFAIGLRVNQVVTSMRQARLDETMQLLNDPPSAKDACWLLNFRNKLYRRSIAIKIEDLPWSVKLTDWDVLPCKAIHRDGQAIVFDGEWKSLPLVDFWHQYCGTLTLSQTRPLATWRIELRRANNEKNELANPLQSEDEGFDGIDDIGDHEAISTP
jgi:hypothetical protein